MSFFESDDSLFDKSVFGQISASTSQDFKPWHKPRKQYIRDKQWLSQFKRLIKDNRYKKVDSVNYFGLPGGDLLDINYLYDGIISSRTDRVNHKKLGFHGFINSDKDFKKAQGELSKLLDKDGIESNSKIEQFNFEDLKISTSDAWHRVRNFGVYHFINLDFCNSVMSKETLTSIYYLIDHQMKLMTELPWLLCITTRLNRDSTSHEIIAKFDEVIKREIIDSSLSEKIRECYQDAYTYISNNAELIKINDKKLFNQILQICLVMWILKEATERNFTVTLKSSFKYSVDLHNRDADMHSFVFFFETEHVIANDTLGLVNNAKTITPVCFSSVASEAIDKLSKSLDVDSLLDEHKDELLKYTESMMNCLSKCGYDISNYKEYMRETYGYDIP